MALLSPGLVGAARPGHCDQHPRAACRGSPACMTTASPPPPTPLVVTGITCVGAGFGATQPVALAVGCGLLAADRARRCGEPVRNAGPAAHQQFTARRPVCAEGRALDQRSAACSAWRQRHLVRDGHRRRHGGRDYGRCRAGAGAAGAGHLHQPLLPPLCRTDSPAPHRPTGRYVRAARRRCRRLTGPRVPGLPRGPRMSLCDSRKETASSGRHHSGIARQSSPAKGVPCQ